MAMEKITKVFALLSIVMVTELHLSMAQCTCSCSNTGTNQEACEKSSTPSDVSHIFLLSAISLTTYVYHKHHNSTNNKD